MVTWLHPTDFKAQMNFASLPSYRTMAYHPLDLSPTSANRQTPLKYRTMQTAPSYAGTMNSPVTWQSHAENAVRFNNWWRMQIWAGLVWPRPYVHWVDCVPFSCCSLIASILAAAHWLNPLHLLLPDYVPISCCSLIASRSDCFHFTCCSPIASTCDHAHAVQSTISTKVVHHQSSPLPNTTWFCCCSVEFCDPILNHWWLFWSTLSMFTLPWPCPPTTLH